MYGGFIMVKKEEFITRNSWTEDGYTNKYILKNFNINCIETAKKILSSLKETKINTAYAYNIYLIVYMLIRDRKLLFSKNIWMLINRVSDSDSALEGFEHIEISTPYNGRGVLKEEHYKTVSSKDIVNKLNEFCEELRLKIRFRALSYTDEYYKYRKIKSRGCGIICRDKRVIDNDITHYTYCRLKDINPNNFYDEKYSNHRPKNDVLFIDDELTNILSNSILEYIDSKSSIYHEISAINNNLNKISTVNPLIFEHKDLNSSYRMDIKEGGRDYYGKNMGLVNIFNFGFTPYLNNGIYLKLFMDLFKNIVSKDDECIALDKQEYKKNNDRYIGYLSINGQYIYLKKDFYAKDKSFKANKYFDSNVTLSGMYNALFMNNLLYGFIRYKDLYRIPQINMYMRNDSEVKLDFYRLLDLFKAFVDKDEDHTKVLNLLNKLSEYQYCNDNWIDDKYYYAESREDALFHNILYYYGKMNNNYPKCHKRTAFIIRAGRTPITRLLESIGDDISLFKQVENNSAKQPLSENSSEEEIQEAIKDVAKRYGKSLEEKAKEAEKKRIENIKRHNDYLVYMDIPDNEAIKKRYHYTDLGHLTHHIFYPRAFDVNLRVERKYDTVFKLHDYDEDKINYITDKKYNLSFSDPIGVSYNRITYDAQMFFMEVFDKLMSGSIIKQVDFKNIPNEIINDFGDIYSGKIIGYRYTINTVYVCMNEQYHDNKQDCHNNFYKAKEFNLQKPYEVVSIFPCMYNEKDDSFISAVRMLNDMGMLNAECTRNKILRGKKHINLSKDEYMDYSNPYDMKYFIFIQDGTSDDYSVSPTINGREKLRLCNIDDMMIEDYIDKSDKHEVFFVDHLGFCQFYLNHHFINDDGKEETNRYYTNAICMNSKMFAYVLNTLLVDERDTSLVYNTFKKILMRYRIMNPDNQFINYQELDGLIKEDFPDDKLREYLHLDDKYLYEFHHILENLYMGDDFKSNLYYFLSMFSR